MIDDKIREPAVGTDPVPTVAPRRDDRRTNAKPSEPTKPSSPIPKPDPDDLRVSGDDVSDGGED